MQTLEIMLGYFLIFLLGLFVGGYMFGFSIPPKKKEILPSSMEEKDKSFRKDGYMEHWLYVHELKALLNQLKDTDWLTPNEVHNLAINREEGFIGIVNFHYNIIEFWEG